MPRGRLCVLALAAALTAALPACDLFDLDAQSGLVSGFEVRPVKVALGAGLDQASASARLAEAAGAYVLPAQKEPGRLPMRNRRGQEIRVAVDGAVARLDLVNAGGTSPIRHITEDHQLAREYEQVVRIARLALTQPAAAPAPSTRSAPAPSGPAKPESKPSKR